MKTTAKEFLQNKYPQMRGHLWNSNPNINDEWVAEIMEEYASEQTAKYKELAEAYRELAEFYEKEFLKNGLISSDGIIGETRLCKIINKLRQQISELRKELVLT